MKKILLVTSRIWSLYPGDMIVGPYLTVNVFNTLYKNTLSCSFKMLHAMYGSIILVFCKNSQKKIQTILKWNIFNDCALW